MLRAVRPALVLLVLAAIAACPRPAIASSLPQPQQDNGLSGVSCTSAADCWAVGFAQDDQNRTFDETFHWTGGAWSSVDGPTSAQNHELGDVSCATPNSCLAIGELGGGASEPTQLVVSWDGSTWNQVAGPAIRRLFLRAVRCVSATNCWAVGWAGPGERSRTVALQWNGQRWRRAVTPDPSARYSNELDSISCLSASDCWAVGQDTAAPLKPTITTYLFALHWNGKTWATEWRSAPYLGGESSQTIEDHIGCATASQCWIVGDASTGPLYDNPLMVRFDGRTWASVRPPRLGSASLKAIDCPARSHCVVVGDTGAFFKGTHTLTLRWDGASWTRADAPTKVGSWDAVSCAAANSCVAVGNTSSAKSAAPEQNLAERLAGGAWSLM